MKRLLTGLILSSLLTLSAAETFVFGTESNQEKAEVSEKDGVYHVVCTIKNTGRNGRVQDSMNEMKAKKICLLGIASFRKREKVSRCSATVRGMSLEKEPKRTGDDLVYVWQVPVDGFIEKKVQTVK